MIRIGHGYDLHRTAPGRRLVLGGVEIPWDRGLLGHSDADVVLHAAADAVLGALALGDLGNWFPDTDERYRDMRSARLLSAVLADTRVRDWGLINLDLTILAERPRLAPYVSSMRDAIAEFFGCDAGCVSVKATTVEGTDAIGRGEAIACHAVILLEWRRRGG